MKEIVNKIKVGEGDKMYKIIFPSSTNDKALVDALVKIVAKNVYNSFSEYYKEITASTDEATVEQEFDSVVNQ